MKLAKKHTKRLEEWDSKNHQILIWFQNTLIPSIRLQFGHLNIAKEAWDLLVGRYFTSIYCSLVSAIRKFASHVSKIRLVY